MCKCVCVCVCVWGGEVVRCMNYEWFFFLGGGGGWHFWGFSWVSSRSKMVGSWGAGLAWVYPCCLAHSKFRSARQSGGYDRFLSQEFAKIWYPITEQGGTERRWRVLCDRRKLVVRSYGSNMAAAEAKLSFDVAVDSVLISLEQKFILKQRLALHSSLPKRTF